MGKMSVITMGYFIITSALLVTNPIIANDKPLHQITKVQPSDTLNLRSKPGVKSDVIARIPANADSISLLGGKISVGETVWLKINWKGQQGWVSQYFLKPMPMEAKKESKQVLSKKISPKEVIPKEVISPIANKVKPVAVAPVEKGVGKNQWILRCSNTKPFWRVDVYPKALKLFTGKYKALLPITYKKQEKNKWNTAKKTHLKGATTKDKIDLEIRYSYKRCDDALSKQKVPYAAIVKHNGKEMKGCCRALKIN